MSGALEWREKYRESLKLTQDNAEAFTGFNANIDIIHEDGWDPEVEPEIPGKVESTEDLKKALSYCRKNAENRELDYSEFEIGGGEHLIGGQGGIIANFLAKTGNEVIFYTPHLSQELADLLDEKILYPVFNEEFYLKNIRDAANSKRTKKNHIFEFDTDRTGRLILSGSIKGYGPYLPKKIEENLELIQQNIDCCILSGFHDVEGNREAKLRKAGKQLEKFSKPVHIEYVHKDNDTARMIIEHVLPEANSLGLDETELELLCSLLGIECEKPLNFGQAFQKCRKLLEELDIERIHLHTFNYHICVTERDYPVEKNEIRKSMLYGEASAIQLADKGRIPDSEDIRGFEPGNAEIRGIKQLEDFGDFQGLESFERSGTAEVEGMNVVGIPVLIHTDPERTVGMGDIISSGAFSSESALREE